MKRGEGVDKKRHVKARHITPSPSIANGWGSKIGHKVVEKPRYLNQVDSNHRLTVVRGVGLLGTMLMDVMKGEDVNLFKIRKGM